MRVLAGAHTGQTGMVLKVDPGTGVCVLHSDTTQEELQVLTRHLARSSATTAALDTCAPWRCAVLLCTGGRRLAR